MAVYKSDTPTKDGRSWYFRIRINGKEYRSGKFKTRKEAQEEEAILLMHRDNPLHKKFTLVAKSYFAYCKETVKEATLVSYLYKYNKYIEPFFKNYDIDFTLQDYKLWFEYMEKQNISAEYKNGVRVVLINILDYAIKNFELQKNVAKIYGTFKEAKKEIHEDKIRYITLEDFNKFISVVDDDLWRTFFIFGFYTGCRKSEIFALQIKDIDFNTDFITINKTISRALNGWTITSTKNNKNRKVKMNRTLKEEMLKYIQQLEKYDDYSTNWFLFGNADMPMARSTADRYKKFYFEKANMQELTYHELFRHSAVSLLMNELLKQDSKLDINKALYTLSSRFGHSPEVMIRTYAHLYEDNIQDPIVDILDNL